MKNKLKALLLSLVVALTIFGPLASVDAYTIEKNLIGNGNPSGLSTYSNKYIILHESGNASNTGADSLDREVSYMKRNWTSAYVSFFVGSGGRVVQLANTGTFQYGALTANGYACAQIELARTNDEATFKKDYESYINLARDLSKKSGIPLTLDGVGNGIKSHNWVTQNLGGDHTDPYGYLASWGITKQQLASDLLNGISSTKEVESEKTTTKPGTSTPTPKTTTQKIYQVNAMTYAYGLWQVKSDYLVPTDFAWYENGIAVGDITLVDAKGNILADQTTKVGSYFIIDQPRATVVSAAYKGSGGYYWSKVKTSTGGTIWLSVWNQSHLING